jgi:hypothetical protein
MEPYQERVVAERDELSEKRCNLISFIETPAFDSLNGAEKDRLRKQATIMTDYFVVLGERIDAFGEPEPRGITSGLSAVDYMLKINRDCLKRLLLPLRERLDIFADTCLHEERKDARGLADDLTNVIAHLQSMVDEITAEQEETP